MSAPDELRQLADRLIKPEATRDDRRAAAVALRHHANLLDAIGDPDGILAGCDASASLWAFHRLRRIADAAAAVSPPPTPTCPTCGSTDPRFVRLFDSWESDPQPCSDPWHQAAT